jgi:hypothetical protein
MWMPYVPDQFAPSGMPAWITLLPAVVFGVFWLICVLHWIRRKRFYPVFANPRSTKLFWGIAFLFFSPLLLLLYVVFGVFMSADRKPARWRSALVLLPVVAVMLLSVFNLLPRSSQHTISARNPKTGKIHTPPAMGISANAGVTKSRINSSSGLSTTNSGNNNLFVLSSVWIQEMDDHPLVQQTARALHARLADYAPITKIGWGPPGSAPPPGEQRYDFFIALSLPDIQETRLPGYRSLSGSLQAEFGSNPFHGNHTENDSFSPPLVACSGTTKLEFQSSHTGLETPRARHVRTGKELADNLFNYLQKTFDGFFEKHGPSATFPSEMYGPWRETLAIPFPEDAKISVVMAGYGLLNHNHSIWRVESGAPPGEFLETLKQTLEAKAWKGRDVSLEEGGGAYLRMKNNEDLFWISRNRTIKDGFSVTPRPDETDGSIYYAHYIDRFNRDEYRALLERMLTSQPTLELLLAFKYHFQRSDLMDAFYQHVEETSPESLDGLLLLARHYLKQENPDKAREMARKAEVLSWFDPGVHTREEELKTLREELGLEKMDPAAPDYTLLRQLGAVFLEEEGFPVVRETKPGHPVIFCWESDATLLGIRLRPLDANQSWQYMHIEVNPGRGWSTSPFSAAVEPGLIFERVETMRVYEQPVHTNIRVERLENGRLRHTFQEQT